MVRSHITSVRAILLVLLVPVLLASAAFAQYAGGTVPPNTPINVPAAPTTDSAVLYPQSSAIVLNSGDQIAIHVLGVPDYAPVVFIAPDGTVQLPYIGIVHVAGLGINDAERLIASDLKTGGFYNDPQVTIQFSESLSHGVNVLGEVRDPKQVPVIASRGLLDVLAAAGGLTLQASHSITILRPSEPAPIVVDLGIDPAKGAAANIPVFARDTVIVPRAGSFYVMGSVKSSGVYPLQPNAPTTLLHAVTMAGGTLFDSELSQVRLIRTEGNTRKQVRVNLSRVIKGKDADPILEPEDVVFVPGSILRGAIKSGGLGVMLTAATVATYYVATQ
jgi:polysaccharide export outer membrane protein